MDIDPSALAIPDRYKLLIGAIVPRPIAWVSTLSPDGRPNLAPFSFFNGVSANPMTLMFCPANKPDGSEKDTLRNAALPIEGGGGGVGEFVINIVPAALARQMAACAEPLDYGHSEWELTGLEPEPSRLVKPARVARSPVCFECKTDRILRLNPGAPSGGNIVVGRVVHVHARDGLVNERLHIDPAQLDAIGRMGGLGYCTTRARFDLPMGREALQAALPPAP
jgi:flavin reductase (DIM6/NTAB) family NADH-FMN oxidoreductase RutF